MPVTRSEYLAEIQALATATPKYLPNFAFLIASQQYTTAQVMTIVDAVLASATTVETTRAAAKDALQADDKVQAQYGPFIKELREVIGVAFSNAAATLAEFDIKPPKPRAPLSVEAKAAANAKKASTRAARGTKGKKQKAAITGSVSGVTITPIETGTAASQTASTSSSSTPAGAGLGAVAPTTGTAAPAPHA